MSMTYHSVLVFGFLLKKLDRCLAKTEQTPSKLNCILLIDIMPSRQIIGHNLKK